MKDPGTSSKSRIARSNFSIACVVSGQNSIQVNMAWSYTRIVTGHCSKFLILRSVRVLANHRLCAAEGNLPRQKLRPLLEQKGAVRLKHPRRMNQG